MSDQDDNSSPGIGWGPVRDSAGFAKNPGLLDQATPPQGIDTTDISGSSPQGGPGAPMRPSDDVQPAPDYANPPEGNALQNLGGSATPIPPTGQPSSDVQPAPSGLNPPSGNEQQPIGPPAPKKIASMLMGDGAAQPQVLEQTKQAVDPHSTQPPGNQVMMAIDAAVQKGDSKGAVALVQAARQGFNARQSFAYTALTGTQQKPADLNAAIDAANQAEGYVPDGSNVKFSHAGDGKVTATVTMAGTTQTQTIPLTTDQFKQFLNVGVNHFDRLYNQTVPATLQQIASGRSMVGRQGGPQAQAGQTAPDQGQTGGDDNDATPSKAVQTGQPQATDVTQGDQPAKPGQFDANGHYTGKPVKSWADQQSEADQHGYGVELEKRSRALFPDVGHEQERQAWMEAQEDKELGRKNAVDVAAEKGKWADKRADTMGGWRQKGEETKGAHSDYKSDNSTDASKYRADTGAQAKRDVAATLSATQKAKIDAALAREAGISQRASERGAITLLRQKLAGNVTDPMTPEENAMVQKHLDAGQPGAAPQAPSGKPPPPPSGQPDHSAAVTWARAHPGDPKAARILAHNGLQ